jgi:hypothetical protein
MATTSPMWPGKGSVGRSARDAPCRFPQRHAAGGQVRADPGRLAPALLGPAAEDGDLRGIGRALGAEIEDRGGLEMEGHPPQFRGELRVGRHRGPWPGNRSGYRL